MIIRRGDSHFLPLMRMFTSALITAGARAALFPARKRISAIQEFYDYPSLPGFARGYICTIISLWLPACRNSVTPCWRYINFTTLIDGTCSSPLRMNLSMLNWTVSLNSTCGKLFNREVDILCSVEIVKPGVRRRNSITCL